MSSHKHNPAYFKFWHLISSYFEHPASSICVAVGSVLLSLFLKYPFYKIGCWYTLAISASGLIETVISGFMLDHLKEDSRPSSQEDSRPSSQEDSRPASQEDSTKIHNGNSELAIMIPGILTCYKLITYWIAIFGIQVFVSLARYLNQYRNF